MARPIRPIAAFSPSPAAAGDACRACEEAGVLGALTGIVGAMMALEVLREIVGFGEGLVGRLLLIDCARDAFRDDPLRL